MEEVFLFTPGPTHIPSRIFEAMHQSSLHHRTEQFKDTFSQIRALFRELFWKDFDPVFFAGSGTAAMEAAMLNLCKPNDKILYLDGGKFGARWGQIAKRLEVNAIPVAVPWGESISGEKLASQVSAHQDARAFFIQHCETSTTVLHPIHDILSVVTSEAPRCIRVVDAISSFPLTPLRPKELGIDVLIGASQKAFMLPPGLAFLCLNERAWEQVEAIPRRSLYFDLLLEREAQSNNSSAWTPASHLLCGFHQALQMISEEGLNKLHARHQQNSETCRKGLKNLGLELIAEAYPSPGLTAAFVPEGESADKLRAELLQQFEYRIAGGQNEWKDRVIRIGHMGYVRPEHLHKLLTKLRQTLR